MNELILPVDEKRLREFTGILQKYKAGKASIERRTVASENWWKLRNSAEERKNTQGQDGFQAASGWLHNVIVSKHADAMDAYPEPNILPREPDDRPEARILTKMLPVILEQNGFEKTYSDAMWQKLKTGTGVYKVFWDPEKAQGLGDIAIERVDLLNVFWEPGVGDIQESRYFFHTRLEDKAADDALCSMPKNRLDSSSGNLTGTFPPNSSAIVSACLIANLAPDMKGAIRKSEDFVSILESAFRTEAKFASISCGKGGT